MRHPDPMADNQTDQTIIALTNGSADNATRDHATAALLASVQRLITKIEEIERSLWKPNDLDRVIDDRHKLACQACPVRKYVLDVQAQQAQTQVQATPVAARENSKHKTSILTFLSNPSSLSCIILAIICIMMALSVVYLSTGRQGFKDITDTAHMATERLVK